MAKGAIRNCRTKSLLPVLPVASTVTGFVNSSDVGKLVFGTSNHGGLAVGTTADAQRFLGLVAAVPIATTPGSSQPFYVQQITPETEIEYDFSTTYSTAMPASTDVGKYVGFGNTTSVAGAVLSMAAIGNAPGSTNGCFLRVTGHSTNRRKIYGKINSTQLVY
jgi:hypothetical protein